VKDMCVQSVARRWRWGCAPCSQAAVARSGSEAEVVSAHGGGLEQVEAAQDLALLTQGEKPRTLTAALLYFVEGYSMEEVGD
jgi:hypothetical protein